jgi:putative aminopeptidase FrvX
MVSIDNGTVGPGQESSELWPSVCMADSSGPFDYHLSRQLLALARENTILHGRDVFRFYRCDSASAVEAGNDIRTALVTFGVDASHGYERTHMDALRRTAQLIIAYARSEPQFVKDAELIRSVEDFRETRTTPVPNVSPVAAEVTMQVPLHPKEPER